MRASVPWTTAAIGLFLLIAAILLRLAWVGDDTYITLRTVENFVAGHGPVWNLGERVQTYTHPLWMLLLCGARLVTGESYFGTIGLSYVVAISATLMLLRQGRSMPGAVAIAALLVWSRSYTEYAVCGLENPLSFVLLVGLAIASRAEWTPARRVSVVATLAGLAAATRMDLVLFFVPVLLVDVRALGFRRWLWRSAIGGLPFVVWLVFATIYYGTPLPVTAYAKAMSHGLPALEMAEQGLQHYVFLLVYDPLTLVVIVVGIALGLFRRDLRARALAVGAILYCGYIVKVGGDFMAGRFFTLPFVVAIAIVGPALTNARRGVALLIVVLATGLGFVSGLPAWLQHPRDEREPVWHHHGILDERSAYFRELGLLSPHRKIPVPGAASIGLQQLGRTRRLVTSAGKAGVYAFEGGELMHFFDPLLCDPLLARLPIADPSDWRIGHIPRAVPEGYLESLAFGSNRIHDPALHRYFDVLRSATQAPVFDRERWQALWVLWTGGVTADLQSYTHGGYREPPRIEVRAKEIAQELSGQLPGLGPLWFDEEQARVVLRGGLAVRFPVPVGGSRIGVQLSGEFQYRFRFERAGVQVAEIGVDLRDVLQLRGMVERKVLLPDNTVFDAVLVDTVEPLPHIVAALGSLRVE